MPDCIRFPGYRRLLATREGGRTPVARESGKNMQPPHPRNGNPRLALLSLGFGVCVCCLALLGCRSDKRAVSEETRPVQGKGFALRYAPSVFQSCQVTTEPKLTMADIGTDIPVDNAPARVKFALRAKTPAYLKSPEVEPWGEGSIRIIPLHDVSVKDFAQAYQELEKQADGLRAILKTGTLHVDKDNSLPDWNCVDKGQTIHAKSQILDGPWCSGIQFLTEYTQELGMPIDNDGLMYKFQGLSRDGAYYVAVEIPVTHPSLPNHVPRALPLAEEKAPAYYAETERRLDGLADETFFPALNDVRAMIQSLRPQGQ
jgi:hypothetical protein